VIRQQLLEPPHPRRERVAVGLDRVAQEARQIGAVLGVKVRRHRGTDIVRRRDWGKEGPHKE
jgi:hypothetical protein